MEKDTKDVWKEANKKVAIVAAMVKSWLLFANILGPSRSLLN